MVRLQFRSRSKKLAMTFSVVMIYGSINSQPLKGTNISVYCCFCQLFCGFLVNLARSKRPACAGAAGED